MKKQLYYFFTAFMFYTRLPVPKTMQHLPDALNKSTKYFTLVGWVVAAISALVYYAAWLLLGQHTLAIILSIIANVLTTGAFHEDGFADVCDGFGGGWTQEKILNIMKDSRVGAFGVIGIVLLLLLKLFCLQAIATPHIFIAMFIAHTISRWAAASIIYQYNYVQADAVSKAKPIAQGFTGIDFFIATSIAFASLFLFKNIWILSLLPTVWIMRTYLARYFKKWIGGYTGDCLGATQQVCELLIYLHLIALWKFLQ